MKMIQHQAFKSAVPPFKSDLTVAIILGIPEYNKVGTEDEKGEFK